MGRDRSGRGRLGLLPQFGVPPGTVPWQMDELGDQSLAKQGDGLAWIRWVHEEGLLTMKGVATLSRVGWRVRPRNVLDRLVAAAAGGVRWAETGRTGERGQMCGSNSAQAEQHRCRREQAAKRHKRGSSSAGQGRRQADYRDQDATDETQSLADPAHGRNPARDAAHVAGHPFFNDDGPRVASIAPYRNIPLSTHPLPERLAQDGRRQPCTSCGPFGHCKQPGCPQSPAALAHRRRERSHSLAQFALRA